MTRARPDPQQVASRLFEKLDTEQRGYLEVADFKTALATNASGQESSNSEVDALFSRLDADSDGRLTQDEFSDALAEVGRQLDEQFQAMRMQGGGPPPPPPAGGDAGFSRDELSAQLDAISDGGQSNTTRSRLIATVLADFDEADADGSGKVDYEEAMVFADEVPERDLRTGDAQRFEPRLLRQILQLVEAYAPPAADESAALSVAA
jgi:Ca2+-binding EF-hand superfamily protein